MEIREPSELPTAPLPETPTPPTVSEVEPDVKPLHFSLDEAIRIALVNCDVVRVLGGSSGQTIYDPAITNTQIDQERGGFDPSIGVQNDFTRRDTPFGVLDPSDPSRALIDGLRTDSYEMAMGLSKTTITGGTAALNVNTSPSRSSAEDLPLNPETNSSVELSFTQPLLRGSGIGPNLAPIEIARIDTERSFFQMKDSVQELLRGVIEAYWALVFARTDVWARQQQVEQGEEALHRAEANLKVGLGDAAGVAQARSSLAGFRADLVTAEASVFEREATLRNILGMPPSDLTQLVPVTPPTSEQFDVEWENVVRTASERRPDLIELKLIIEADEQRHLMARRDSLPQVDATALYRWNGLEGRMPDRSRIASGAGQFTGWQLGVNFSVPLGLRRSRAVLRQQELIIMRDHANLRQGLHNALHVLAKNYRNLSQYYEQYRAFKEARTAARTNLDVQVARYRSGQDTLYLNVLQAITQWGNSVSAEAQALTQYNSELANLERQAGVILEAHGVTFTEERYGSIGPLGRLFYDRCYPKDSRPGPNADQYETDSEPAENVFDLDAPMPPRREN